MRAAIILVGGKSKRYGSPKALEVIEGKTFFERIYDIVDQVADKVYVSVSKHTPPSIHAMARMKGAKIVPDETYPCGGPPRALLSVYNNYKHNKYLVVGVDYPFINRDIIEKLYEYSSESRLSALTPVLVKGYPLVMIGVLSLRSLEILKKACYVKQSKTRLSDAYRAAYISGFYGWRLFTDDPRSFSNINSPDEIDGLPVSGELFTGDRVHVKNNYYPRMLKCLENNDVKCALMMLEKEKELYESKGISLFSRHVAQDILWLSNEGVY
ncbi:MAG: molybdenum cofactor guanylyltransferase [Desulfurococcales archaeon]|nr:molybdenum cofactor guanylyltransferase [Desulfurococcales archaeon]